MKNINAINLCVTYNCNSRCNSCQIWKIKDSPNINISDLNNFLNQKSLKNLKEISITGGEPTLHPEIIEIARIISEVKNVNEIYFTTNGIRTEKIIEILDVLYRSRKNSSGCIS
ncbi:radical SAM protein [Vibrio rhizosphaerae]|uniref:radical SAM protein n=1 Tax=Vibrio rhizosphaerae TaxID=398736 RepID=UPI000571E32A|nr:radical SAM protein [Vibrio rhizosphaerae]